VSQLTLTLAIACVGAALGAAFAVGADTASEEGASLEKVRVAPARIADRGPDRTRKPDDVVCPGIALKVGPTVLLPCGRGAEILEATSLRIDGAYCAKVTYIAERGAPARTETLCEGDRPRNVNLPKWSRLPR
jgi:hypothetical protein